VARTNEQAANDRQSGASLRQQTLSNGALKRYVNEAAAYYVERRCRHLSQSQVMDFWRKIAAKHNALIGRFGPDAVRSAKNQAISSSRRTGGCNNRTVKIVKAGYRSIVR
jgi:hypothetical protein